MIRIGLKEIGISIFDYRNEVVVDFRICADKLMIIYDKKTSMSYDEFVTQISVDKNSVYYMDFVNLYEKLSLKLAKTNSKEIKHSSNDDINTNICINKEEDLINYQFSGNKDYIFIDKNCDDLGLFDIYINFILDMLKHNLNKYDYENKKFNTYLNDREYYYEMLIDKRYDDLNALLYLIHYRQSQNNFSMVNLKKDVSEIQKLFDEIRCIRNEQTIYYRNQIEQKDKEIKKLRIK